MSVFCPRIWLGGLPRLKLQICWALCGYEHKHMDYGHFNTVSLVLKEEGGFEIDRIPLFWFSELLTESPCFGFERS